MNKIEYLKLARELFGHMPFEDLIKQAEKLHSYLEVPGNSVEDLRSSTELLESTVLGFAKRCSILNPVIGLIPFKPYDYQAKILEMFDQDRNFILINSARQMGMSTLLDIYALHRALTQSHQTIMIMGPKFNIVAESMVRITNLYQNLEGTLPAVVTKNKDILEFDNGSKIVCRKFSDSSFRGYSCDLVIITEAAYIPYADDTKIWNSLIPSLGTGQLVVQSTPNKPQGLFHTLWSSNPNTITRVKVEWYAHPERNQEWAEKQKQHISEASFRKEYECEFVSDSTLYL